MDNYYLGPTSNPELMLILQELERLNMVLVFFVVAFVVLMTSLVIIIAWDRRPE
jgi:hypothetical protein